MMRSVLKVMLAFLNTVLFFLVGSNLINTVSDFLYWLDFQSLFAVLASIAALTLFVISFLLCVFHGYKSDETDVWSKEKKERGWSAYSAFVGASFALVLSFFVPDFSYSTTFFDIFMAVVCIVVAVIGYAVGAFALAELEKYESAISDEDLKKLLSELTDDYLEVNLDRVASRVFDGFSTEVTIEEGSEPSKVVLDFDPDEAWYTASGSVVKLFTYKQWGIVFNATKKVVTAVYESKIYPAKSEQ